MAEKYTNLLLHPNVPATGNVQFDSVVGWYGGPIAVTATMSSPADIELLVCTKLPALGEGETYADHLEETDFVNIHTFTDTERFTLDNLNPCLLAIRGPLNTLGVHIIVT